MKLRRYGVENLNFEIHEHALNGLVSAPESWSNVILALLDESAVRSNELVLLVRLIDEAPGLETLWQLHESKEAGPHNAPAEFIANTTGPDAANYLKVTVNAGGSFSVLNPRTGASKDYPRR